MKNMPEEAGLGDNAMQQAQQDLTSDSGIAAQLQHTVHMLSSWSQAVIEEVSRRVQAQGGHRVWSRRPPHHRRCAAGSSSVRGLPTEPIGQALSSAHVWDEQ
ncbi:hypothetical protein Esti_006230 [Eimeria stiedai]